MPTFWDLCAPFYDLAEKANGRAYQSMLKTVREYLPGASSILEIAAGTGAISLAVADKAGSILCTDLSDNMLKIAKKKATKRGIYNITFDKLNIFETGLPEKAFDVVIAAQVLHLIDHPEKAAAELRRIAKDMVILPISLTKNASGRGKFGLRLYRLFGFSPKLEFDAEEYAAFLPEIGFDKCEMTEITGRIPMAVAVWKRR